MIPCALCVKFYQNLFCLTIFFRTQSPDHQNTEVLNPFNHRGGKICSTTEREFSLKVILINKTIYKKK